MTSSCSTSFVARQIVEFKEIFIILQERGNVWRMRRRLFKSSVEHVYILNLIRKWIPFFSLLQTFKQKIVARIRFQSKVIIFKLKELWQLKKKSHSTKYVSNNSCSSPAEPPWNICLYILGLIERNLHTFSTQKKVFAKIKFFIKNFVGVAASSCTLSVFSSATSHRSPLPPLPTTNAQIIGKLCKL